MFEPFKALLKVLSHASVPKSYFAEHLDFSFKEPILGVWGELMSILWVNSLLFSLMNSQSGKRRWLQTGKSRIGSNWSSVDASTSPWWNSLDVAMNSLRIDFVWLLSCSSLCLIKKTVKGWHLFITLHLKSLTRGKFFSNANNSLWNTFANFCFRNIFVLFYFILDGLSCIKYAKPKYAFF